MLIVNENQPLNADEPSAVEIKSARRNYKAMSPANKRFLRAMPEYHPSIDLAEHVPGEPYKYRHGWVRLYHGTSAESAALIQREGLRENASVPTANWYQLTTSREQAERYSKDGTVVEFKVPESKIFTHSWETPDAVLWPGDEHNVYGFAATAYAVKTSVPASMVTRVHPRRRTDLAEPYQITGATNPNATAVVQPPPNTDETVQHVVEILLAGYALLKTAQMIAAIVKIPFKILAAIIESTGGMTGHTAHASLQYVGLDPNSPGAHAAQAAARQEIFYRASYILHAAERVGTDVVSGKPLPQALAEEKTIFHAHEAARRGRMGAAARVGRAANMFGDILGWYLNPVLNNEPECIAADGHNFRASEGTILGWPGAVHPNCLPGSTRVAADAGHTAMKRWYEGDLVEVRTERGHVLAGTPNHPVLAVDHWRGLGSFDLGDEVMTQAVGEGPSWYDPANDNETIAIEQRFHALRVASGVVPVSVPMTAEDFHGDGFAGEVDVVGAERDLWLEAQRFQPRPDDRLVSVRRELALAGTGSPVQFGVAGPSAANRVMRRAGAGGPLIGGEPRRPDDLLFADRSDPYPVLGQRASDGLASYAVPSRELLDTLSPGIRPDKIIEIRRYPFRGHVYNLSSNCGCYVAGGVVAHNCGCVAGPPHVEAVSVNEAVARARNVIIAQRRSYGLRRQA